MKDEARMDAVLQALGNESRRRMLDIVKANPGIGVGELAGEFDVSRIAVMKHLGVLEAAGLIVSEKDGRKRRLYFNVAPIQLIYDRWTTEYSGWWAGQMTGIKYRAEARHVKEKNKNKKRKVGK
jgi:DNA-binding transcriptional ArsR family regulator